MRHTQFRFVGAKGFSIYRQCWAPAESRGAVVLCHGLGEHSGRYRHVAEALVAEGLTVHAMDHRGHGQSDGKPAMVDRFANAVADIDQVVDIAGAEAAAKPVFLLGHSMGGALALQYTLGHQDKLAGLVLSGPAVALDGAPPMIGPISKLLSRFTPGLGLFPVDPSLVSRDPQAISDYASDPLNAHGKVPARTLGEIVRFAEKLPKRLAGIHLPMFVMHGSEDKLAGVAGSEMIINGVRSRDKSLKVYPGLYHEIFNELPDERRQVIADLCQWIGSRIPAVEAGEVGAA